MLGKTVGSYRITEKIGQGGMAVVYSAQHTSLNSRVVVKVLRRHLLADQEIKRRFQNEAKAAARIRHPGIVDVMDIGEFDHGGLYIMMEHLDGENLRERLDRVRRVPIGTGVSFIRQAADALGAAHAQNIVHRDLKPANIFLVKDQLTPEGERVKLLDFGIAKLMGPERNVSMQTRTGIIMGTPIYMSPEQCRGLREVDHRTDLYALGGILFELLCGRPPFPSKAPGELIALHMTRPPPSARSLNSAITPEIDAIIARLLAKEPNERFQTTAELVTALDAAVAGLDSLNTQEKIPPQLGIPPTMSLPAAPIGALPGLGGGRSARKKRRSQQPPVGANRPPVAPQPAPTRKRKLTPTEVASQPISALQAQALLQRSGGQASPGLPGVGGIPSTLEAPAPTMEDMAATFGAPDDDLAKTNPMADVDVDALRALQRPTVPLGSNRQRSETSGNNAALDPGTGPSEALRSPSSGPAPQHASSSGPSALPYSSGSGANQPALASPILPDSQRVPIPRPPTSGAAQRVRRESGPVQPMHPSQPMPIAHGPSGVQPTVQPSTAQPITGQPASLAGNNRTLLLQIGLLGGAALAGLIYLVVWMVGNFQETTKPQDAAIAAPDDPNPGDDVSVASASVVAKVSRYRPAVIAIGGGTYMMGSPDSEIGRPKDETPRHRVTLSPFYLCRTEVTQAQWKALVGTNPSACKKRDCEQRQPVSNVSWFDAIRYMNLLSDREGLSRCYKRDGDTVSWTRPCAGYRLPTEAEWEYAARAGSTTIYSFGGDPKQLGDYAWYADNADDEAHVVASKQPNKWGLHDMHGNVLEWVWDRFARQYPGESQTDPIGPTDGPAKYVLRGGSFRNQPKDLRSASRYLSPPNNQNWDVGLRCARSAPASK